jgi:hypothetical protein
MGMLSFSGLMDDHSCPKQEKKINAEDAKVAEEKMQKLKA